MPATATRQDYYEILGVSKDASKEEIRRAYLELARKYHPDKTGGDKAAEEKLKEINAAYDTLKNPEKRKEYDAMQASPFWGGPGFQGNAQEGYGAGEGFGFDFSLGDLFGDLFGRGGKARPAGPRRGQDIEVRLDVSLFDVVDGVKKTVRVPRRAACGTCKGTGAAPGTKPETCPQCHGSGQATQGGGAHVFVSQSCPKCHGTGQVIAKLCAACKGAGQTTESRTVTVTIPAGADTGTRLRLAGQGNAGEAGAPSGDLFVVVNVLKDAFFERSGNDVVCEAPITFAQAALGDTIRVPTLKGQADLRVPAGTQSGQVLRLRGLGLPAFRGRGKGDQLVRVQVEVPTRLSREAEEVVRRLKEIEEPGAYPRRRSFLERLGRGRGR